MNKIKKIKINKDCNCINCKIKENKELINYYNNLVKVYECYYKNYELYLINNSIVHYSKKEYFKRQKDINQRKLNDKVLELLFLYNKNK